MERRRKKYEELTIVDDFMFGKVMRNPRYCKKLLEIILGVKIHKIVFLDDQDSMNPNYDARSIRLDIYVEDDDNTVYAVEMQLENTGVLPKRCRYYQSIIDINLIEKGIDLDKLKRSYVIFICTFDLFGKGRHIYRFENLCREDTSIRLDDGTEKIFLNTKGVLNDVDGELKNLLKYFETQIPQDDYTRELEEAVMGAIDRKAFKVEYMFQYAKECQLKKEGIEQGRIDGAAMKLVSQVCRKLAKDKSVEVIAEELDEPVTEIRRIVEIATKFAPDYDEEKIYNLYRT